MTRLILKAITLSFTVLLTCCSEENLPYTIVQTGEVVSTDNNSVLFSAEVINSTEPILEYGFKWELQIYAKEAPKNYISSVKGTPAGNYFETRVSSSMLTGREYFVRAYVRTSKGISYGRYVEFIGAQNLPPQITDIKPDSVLLYDTIMVMGNNLGFGKSDIILKAGSINLTVLRATQDTIFARIPLTYNLASSPLSVQIFSDYFDISDKQICLKPFMITSISPDTAKQSTYVKVYMKNFRKYYNPEVSLMVNSYPVAMAISEVTNNYINCKVPNRIGSYYVDVYISGTKTSSPLKLTVLP